MLNASVRDRFSRLGELEKSQINQLHYEISRRLVDMRMAVYETRGSAMLMEREQEPERNALVAMLNQTQAEAIRRGMLWIDSDFVEGGRKPTLIVPVERVIEHIKELESSVDKMLRESING